MAGAASCPMRDIRAFTHMRQHCRGMLGERVYEALYHAIGGLSTPGAIVEAGTGHAAATVAAAWAVKDSRADRVVYTVDRVVGGTADIYGGPEFNKQIILNNLAAFGVAEVVQFKLGTVQDLVTSGTLSGPVAAVILDADGCIDRDLAHLAPYLAAGGLCVIDDYADHVSLTSDRGGTYRIDGKMKLTYDLVNVYADLGILKIHQVVGRTVFAPLVRPERLTDPDVRDLVLDVYRRQVFLVGKKTSRLRVVRAKCARLARESVPHLYRQYRQLRLRQ